MTGSHIKIGTVEVDLSGVPNVNAAFQAGSVRLKDKPKVRRTPGSWLGELFGKPRVYEVSYEFIVEPSP